METVALVEGLSFSYGENFHLDSISFKVTPGEVLTLLGPNGCGKTTLIKCMNALLKPNAGKVTIAGKSAQELDRWELARLVGYVPQAHIPPFPYSVLDLVLMGRTAYLNVFQQPSMLDYRVAEEALSMVGLSHLRGRAYDQISGGERQLVLIARAIAQEPKLLLLDEPTAHLDFKNQISILGMVRRITKEKKISVVTSLHDPNHALMFSDTVALMKNGSFYALGPPRSVITKKNIETVYEIDVDIITHADGILVVPSRESFIS